MHYIANIRLYGSAPNFDTSMSEALHKDLIKAFFHRTNKNLGFEEQILYYNTRRHNMAAMKDVLLFTQTNPQSQADVDSQSQVTTPTRDPIDLTALGIPCGKEEAADMEEYGLKSACWRQARSVGDMIEIYDFLDALAVFVRESKIKNDGTGAAQANADRQENNPAWVGDYYISIHSSLKC